MVRKPFESRERNRPGRFGLGWAIGISIVFHLLLILFSTWVPLDTRSAMLEPAEDNSLRFTFMPPVEQEQEQEGEKKGDVPLPQPEEQPSLALPPVLEQLTPQTQPLAEPELPQEELPPPEDGTAEERVEQMTPENTLPAENDGLRRQELPDNSQRQTRDDDAGGEIRAGLRDFKRNVDLYQAQRREQEALTGSIRNVFVPDMSNVPISGSPYGILEFESRDYDFEDYSRQIYWAILYAWYRRLDMTTPDFEKWALESSSYFLEHQTRLRFVIEDGGDVSGIELEIPAGCPPLDVSALEAMAEVILPPLPADFPRESEVVHATFLIKGPVMSMHQMLQYYKSIGYF